MNTDKIYAESIAKDYAPKDNSKIVALRKLDNRAKLPATRNLTLHAARIGNFAFITAPYEMFAQSGMDIKAGSPFDLTFIISMQHGSDGYIPTKPAYDYGCYESHTGKYAPGTAELLVEEFVGMLNTLHETAK